MRIVFMGTPKAAADCLQTLIDAQETVVCAVTQPDRPQGRHLHPKASPVKELALRYKIPVETPDKVKDQIFIDKIKAYAPELIVVVAYGKILPKEILTIPKHGALNVHASLLPKYRGAAPVQWALLKGENETGVTVMQISESLDTGDILLQDRVSIDPDDNAETLLNKVFDQGASTLLHAIEQIKQGTIKRVPQNESAASYAPSLTKESGEIDWRRSATEINNRVRALIPWPVAHTFYKGKMLKIFKARTAPLPEKAAPGEILSTKEELIVACGAGALIIREVQPESGRRMSSGDFIRGHHLKVSEVWPS